jgi:hypothetical protein
VGDPLIGHGGWVTAVAVGRLGERKVIVSAGGDGTVRIWSAAGRSVGNPLHLVEVCAGLVLLDCGLIVATGAAVALLEPLDLFSEE